MNPVLVSVLLFVFGLAVNTLWGFFLAGRIAGRYEEKFENFQKNCQNKAEKQDGIIEMLRGQGQDFVERIARLEGRLDHGRKI